MDQLILFDAAIKFRTNSFLQRQKFTYENAVNWLPCMRHRLA